LILVGCTHSPLVPPPAASNFAAAGFGRGRDRQKTRGAGITPAAAPGSNPGGRRRRPRLEAHCHPSYGHRLGERREHPMRRTLKNKDRNGNAWLGRYHFRDRERRWHA